VTVRAEQAIQETLVIGTELDYPPYSFIDAQGKPAGYNIELIKALAKTMQMDIDIQITSWNTIRKSLENGELDAIVGMYYSRERDQVVDFSPPFSVVHHAIFVRRSGPDLETEQDLKEKEIIVMRGDIMHDYALQNGLGQNLALVKTQSDALKLLASGKHDCALLAKLPGLYWIEQLDLSNLTTTGPLLRPSDYSYAVAEDNTALLARLSEGLAILEQTGKKKAIYDKWLGVLQPRGISPAQVLWYIGLAILPLLLLIGVLMLWSRTLRRQVETRTRQLREKEARLEHLNEVLAAIRNVNQLVTRETDKDRLLDQACQLLVEARGFHNAWIALVTDGIPNGAFFYAGFNSAFVPMAEKLRMGQMPACAQDALVSRSIQVIEDPQSQCPDCPLACLYNGRSVLTMVLEHHNRVFGWLSLSVPQIAAFDQEEHNLFIEVVNDIAYALWSLDTAAQHKSIEQEYAEVLANSNDAIIATDNEGIIRVFNLGAEKLLECPVDQALGLSFSRFCPKERLEEIGHITRQVYQTGLVRNYETERITARGNLVPVEVTLNLRTDSQGQPIGMTGILRDMRDKKQTEKRMHLYREQLELAMDAGENGIWDWDLDSDDIYFSPRYYTMLGYEPGELPMVKETWTGLIHPEDRERIVPLVDDYVKKAQPYALEFRMQCKDGNWKWISGRGKTFEKDAYGQPHRAVGVHIDITAIKRVQEELDRVNTELSIKNKELEQILYTTSHDLRSPLVNVQGFNKELQASLNDLKEILKSEGVSESVRKKCAFIIEEDIPESMHYILSSTSKMDGLLSGLLVLSRLGRQKMTFKDLDLNALLQEVINTFEYEIQEKNVTLDVSDLPDCYGDELQINQVFSNLVNNALKYLHPNRQGLIRISGQNTGQWVSYVVQDNGLGIPGAQQGKIFELFYKLDPKTEGMGLGLSIVKQILDRHGGRIEVRSEEEKGTAFVVSLPVHDHDTRWDGESFSNP
jgi:PAS domain S-box-containing protein